MRRPSWQRVARGVHLVRVRVRVRVRIRVKVRVRVRVRVRVSSYQAGVRSTRYCTVFFLPLLDCH